jgi:hypothetical protein
LVARGFQDMGTEDLMTSSPTAAKVSWRMIISACVARNWLPRTVDIKTAFLQGKAIGRPVFLKPPAEAMVPGDGCWKLVKSVYGLGDAPRLWFETVRDFLI